MRQALVVLGLLAFSAVASAQDIPVPKMFQGLQGQKGQYRVEILEGGGRAGRGTSITVCSDNLIRDAGAGRQRPQSDCTQRLLKDTEDEALFERECKDRKTTVHMKREGNSVLMDIVSSGERERQMKMRYTHLGPCKEGQGEISLDKDSEACRKIRARAEKMDPAKQCARSKDREACEQKLRDTAEKLSAMCR